MNGLFNIVIPQLIGAGLIILFFILQRKRKRLKENGIEVKGIISEKCVDDIPTIRFVTKEGVWVTEKADISSENFDEGQEVSVIYNPEDPKEFIYITTYDTSKHYYWLLIAGILLICMGLWFSYKYVAGTL